MIKVVKDQFVVLCSEGVLALPLSPPPSKSNLCYLIMHALFLFTFQILLTSLQFLRFCFFVFIFSKVVLSPCFN